MLADDGVHIMTSNYFTTPSGLPRELKNISGRYPKLVFLDLPSDPKVLADLKEIQRLIKSPPFIDRKELYQSFGDVEVNIMTQRFVNYHLDQKENCYWMPIYSGMFNGRACLHLKKGVIKIRRE